MPPSSAICYDTAKPMPVDDAVTTHTLPSNLFLLLYSVILFYVLDVLNLEYHCVRKIISLIINLNTLINIALNINKNKSSKTYQNWMLTNTVNPSQAEQASQRKNRFAGKVVLIANAASEVALLSALQFTAGGASVVLAIESDEKYTRATSGLSE